MIVVLGLDGLEYSLVEEFKLKNIKQKNHTKTSLEEYDVVVTPPIWASMLIGEIEKDMMNEFRMSSAYAAESDAPWMQLVRKALPSQHRMFLGRLWDKIIRSIRGNPMVNTKTYLDDVGRETIFDFFDDPKYNKIPGFNDDSGRGILASDITTDNIHKHTRDKYLNEIKENKVELLEKLKGSSDFVFWYFHALDSLGHVDFGNKLNMMDYYSRVNKMVGEIKSILDDDDILYIISDHGMKKSGKWGIHSQHGFFSSNTGELIEKPYEIYDLILSNHS